MKSADFKLSANYLWQSSFTSTLICIIYLLHSIVNSFYWILTECVDSMVSTDLSVWILISMALSTVVCSLLGEYVCDIWSLLDHGLGLISLLAIWVFIVYKAIGKRVV
jgi:hypothetical protein